jgi:folate-dependent tRNA-U54 methylase TrmFO/GidA
MNDTRSDGHEQQEGVRTDEMELQGKNVIALGERDSVPGEAIAAVARSAGAEVIETRTECFV